MIEILSTAVSEPLAAAAAASFDLPRTGTVPTLALRIAMWFRRPDGEPPGEVLLALTASPQSEPVQWELRRAAVAPRTDVPARDGETALGFDLYVDGVELPREFEVDVSYRPRSGGEEELGRVRGRRAWLAGSCAPRFEPVLVASQGRMGTTALMKALGQHPACVVHPRYPFENAQAVYYARIAAALLRTPNLLPQPDRFSGDLGYAYRTRRAIGANPFLHPDYVAHEDLEATLAEQAPHVADFVRAAVDRVYARVAAATGREEGGRFLLEKSMRPTSPGELLWIYPRVRMVLLTRDPRDVFRSAREFNARRGRPSFLRELCADEESWIDLYSQRISCLVDVFEKHPAEDRLHLRYEDLVRRPREELGRVARWIEPATPDRVVADLVAALATDEPRFRRHRTRAAGTEIGSWTSLSAAEVERILDRTRVYRERFGYPAG